MKWKTANGTWLTRKIPNLPCRTCRYYKEWRHFGSKMYHGTWSGHCDTYWVNYVLETVSNTCIKKFTGLNFPFVIVTGQLEMMKCAISTSCTASLRDRFWMMMDAGLMDHLKIIGSRQTIPHLITYRVMHLFYKFSFVWSFWFVPFEKMILKLHVVIMNWESEK